MWWTVCKMRRRARSKTLASMREKPCGSNSCSSRSKASIRLSLDRYMRCLGGFFFPKDRRGIARVENLTTHELSPSPPSPISCFFRFASFLASPFPSMSVAGHLHGAEFIQSRNEMRVVHYNAFRPTTTKTATSSLSPKPPREPSIFLEP
jgi:hypothetical protein